MKSWQIFFCEKKADGTWFQGKRPAHVLFQKDKAEDTLKRLNKNTGVNQRFVMVEV